MTVGEDSAGTLYLVATPIGNLSDLSPRASEVFGRSDLIACEDTRVTKKLLDHLSLSKPLVSYREENELKKTTELVGLLEQGKSIALVSDAGYPGISDPGFRLVRNAEFGESRSFRSLVLMQPLLFWSLRVSPRTSLSFLDFFRKNQLERGEPWMIGRNSADR